LYSASKKRRRQHLQERRTSARSIEEPVTVDFARPKQQEAPSLAGRLYLCNTYFYVTPIFWSAFMFLLMPIFLSMLIFLSAFMFLSTPKFLMTTLFWSVFEEDMLSWEQQQYDKEGTDSGAESGSGLGPMGKEL
jgi:hypothetical protein